MAGVSIAMWLIIVRPYPKIDVNFSMGELAMYFSTYYRERLDQAAAEGNFRKEIRYGEQLLGTMPGFVKHVEDHLPLQTTNQKNLVRYYSNIYSDLGNTYRDNGQQQKADEYAAMKEKLFQASE